MGVKSTVDLTRAEAESRYIAFRLKELQTAVEVSVKDFTDVQLEDRLERLNDDANGGEGYENYMIVPADAR